MSAVSIVSGDVLTYKADCIVQQCNCVAVRPHGLSASIAKAFPYADIYGQRRAIGNRNLARVEDRSQVGTCVLAHQAGSVIVACLMGQYVYGKPSVYSSVVGSTVPDDAKTREQYFEQALQDMATQLETLGTVVRTIAFPYQIGCGLAGGDWSHYSSMIAAFAEAHPAWSIYIVRQ